MWLTYVFEELFCDDSCSCVECDLHLTDLLVNVLHKLHTQKAQNCHQLLPSATHHMPYLNHKVN